eukprot:TRINITY_DN5670_c0_g1_i1.p1 TRINITY_DN5670_c0_g1~~TRINITY_DN5670_c0_g1_i1.p1  ORF type:complete len:501 (+),score=37.19 TRINITY_DN5670_c0_g1_i1:165-1667(+)
MEAGSRVLQHDESHTVPRTGRQKCTSTSVPTVSTPTPITGSCVYSLFKPQDPCAQSVQHQVTTLEFALIPVEVFLILVPKILEELGSLSCTCRGLNCVLSEHLPGVITMMCDHVDPQALFRACSANPRLLWVVLNQCHLSGIEQHTMQVLLATRYHNFLEPENSYRFWMGTMSNESSNEHAAAFTELMTDDPTIESSDIYALFLNYEELRRPYLRFRKIEGTLTSPILLSPRIILKPWTRLQVLIMQSLSVGKFIDYTEFLKKFPHLRLDLSKLILKNPKLLKAIMRNNLENFINIVHDFPEDEDQFLDMILTSHSGSVHKVFSRLNDISFFANVFPLRKSELLQMIMDRPYTSSKFILRNVYVMDFLIEMFPETKAGVGRMIMIQPEARSEFVLQDWRALKRFLVFFPEMKQEVGRMIVDSPETRSRFILKDESTLKQFSALFPKMKRDVEKMVTTLSTNLTKFRRQRMRKTLDRNFLPTFAVLWVLWHDSTTKLLFWQ